MKRQETYRRGLIAEGAAKWFLRVKGYRILRQRYKCPLGEIDIIARKGDTIVFVEVKHRQTGDKAREAISPRQQQRITRAAEHFLKSQGTQHIRCRFDAVLLHPPFGIDHIKNAWGS